VPHRLRPRRLSLRARLTLIATAGLAVGLGVGGLLLVAVLGSVLVRGVDAGSKQTADAVVDLINEGALSDPIPTGGTQVVQVLDANSRVRAASAGADRLVPMLREDELERARAGHVVTIPGYRVGEEGFVRVVAATAGLGENERTVLVAGSVRDTDRSLSVVRFLFLGAYPLLLAAIAALTWRVVGATLRPVEELRAGAEEISASHSGRLPVPGGADELHRLGVTLNAMIDRLESARTRQRAFVADAAHELRSPLASLRTQLDVAEHLGEAPPVGDLSAEVDRLTRLVDDLLVLARADDGSPGPKRREPVDVGALLAAVVQGYAGARVPVTAGDCPEWISADPDSLRRILDNLVANAVRHAATAVRLTGARAGDQLRLEVVDDGPGIPAADRERVFDRFTRLDDARARDDGGAGLGLSIVRELAAAHGGTVRLADARPGVRAVVTLPVGEPGTPRVPGDG
jgi:signal transduction histidine kinase